MRPQTRPDLDGMPCGHVGCKHSEHSHDMYLNPRCHPGGATQAKYRDGIVTIECVRCRAIVVQVAVARYLDT